MAKLTLYPSDALHARLAQTLMLLEAALPFDAADAVWSPANTVAGQPVSGLAQPKPKRASGVTGKVRNYPCEHRRPAGAFCKICDAEEAT
jgi:hypothetical protein